MEILYARTEGEFLRGTFRVKGDTIDIYPAYADFGYRFYFFGDELEMIHRIDPITNSKIAEEDQITLYPANLFVKKKIILLLMKIQIQNTQK